MDPFDLPRELAEVERRLAERSHPKPASVFRRRVLLALRDEPKSAPLAWRLAVLAAAVLLVLNLAMSLHTHCAGPRLERRVDDDLVTTVREMRQRHPDLSEPEAYQLALLVQSPPALPASLGRIVPLEGEESWDMR
jgi:hypothetical protein